jgi:succinate dehydrogenase / fumarate reductase, cytochrome b subunit
MSILAFWRSTIGKKIVMAITGLIMVGFVIAHVAGNLLVFAGPARINAYGAFLKSTGELLWVARLVLLTSVVLHIMAAVQLTAIERAARPVGYARHQYQAASLASRTIRWGGVILGVFIVYHLLHFTVGSVHPDFSETDIYHNIVSGFAVKWVAVFYVIAMAALGLHLYHGAWSSVRTLGLSKPSPSPLVHRVSLILAIVVAGLFAAIPLAVLFGVLK